MVLSLNCIFLGPFGAQTKSQTKIAYFPLRLYLEQCLTKEKAIYRGRVIKVRQFDWFDGS